MRPLEGKAAVVTGAGGSIGRAVSLALAHYGAKIIVNDVGGSIEGKGTDSAPAESTVAQIRSSGGEAEVNVDDVSTWSSAQAIVQSAIDHFGRLDFVVNNAGIIRSSEFSTMPVQDFEDLIRVHLMGSFYVSRAAAPHLQRNGGAYVHMTSSAALVGARNMAGYVSAKMGIAGLSRSIAMEMTPLGVRSNCVAPHAFSRMVFSGRSERDEALMQALEKRRETNRPEQVAELVAFLLSDGARDISGQVFGARGNEIYLYNQPRPVRTLHRADGWTPERLEHVLPKAWQAFFTPLEDTADVFSWDAI